MEFKRIRLENGLEIIGEVNQEACSLSFGAFVRTGSRDENDAISGCSHFLEHMIFKGTEKRTAADVNRELDELGGRSNAYTSDEATVFYASVLPELRSRIVDLLLDLMRPIFRPEDFDMEKQVILEEISMYKDQPPFGIEDRSKELFFGDHPLAQSVLGSLESIRDLSIDQMRDYFDRQYCPGNIIFAAAGKFDFDHLVEEIEKIAGSWPSRPLNRKKCRSVAHSGIHRFTKPTATQDYVFQIVSAPSSQCDAERYPASLAANMIGDDVGSRMFWELVDNGAADSANLSFFDYTDAGTFTSVLCCKPEDTERNLEIITRIFQKVQKEGFTVDELERAKNKILSHIVLASERPIGRLFSTGTEWLQTGSHTTIREEIDHFKRISLDQVNEILQKYPLDNPLQVSIGPEKSDS